MKRRGSAGRRRRGSKSYRRGKRRMGISPKKRLAKRRNRLVGDRL